MSREGSSLAAIERLQHRCSRNGFRSFVRGKKGVSPLTAKKSARSEKLIGCGLFAGRRRLSIDNARAPAIYLYERLLMRFPLRNEARFVINRGGGQIYDAIANVSALPVDFVNKKKRRGEAKAACCHPGHNRIQFERVLCWSFFFFFCTFWAVETMFLGQVFRKNIGR